MKVRKAENTFSEIDKFGGNSKIISYRRQPNNGIQLDFCLWKFST